MTETKRVAVTLSAAVILQAEAEAARRGLSREKVLAEKFAASPGQAPFELIPLEQIDPNPYQPRKEMDREAIESLARGIKLKRASLPDTLGLMQVPIARRVPPSVPPGGGEEGGAGRVQLAFGHRRWEAFKHLYRTEVASANWWQMPLVIAPLDDEQMYDFAARENGDREELNPVEKARSIKRAMEEMGWDLTRAANAHGLSKSAGSNLTRLLQLPEEVLAFIHPSEDVGGERRTLSQRHARELVRLVQFHPPLTQECVNLAKTVLREDYTVATTRELVDNAIRKDERARFRQTRYCYTCGTPREFTGIQLDAQERARCGVCGETWTATWYTANPPSACGGCGEAYNGMRWHKVNNGAGTQWYCDSCSHKRYEETRCPRCRMGLVYYSKAQAGLVCEGCRGRWDYTADFKKEVAQAEERLRQAAQAAQSRPTEPSAALSTLESNRQVIAELRAELSTQTANPLWRHIPDTAETCYLCGRQAVYHNNGWYDKPGADFHLCGACYSRHSEAVTGFASETELRAALDALKAAAEDDTPPPAVFPENAPRDASRGNCAACGAALTGPGWRFLGDPARSVCDRCSDRFSTLARDSKFDCPRCKREKVVHLNGGAWCLACDTKWPARSDFESEAQPSKTVPSGQQARRQVLNERLEGLTRLIEECPTDRLYEIEGWFDDIESAFAAPPEWATRQNSTFVLSKL